MHEENYAITRQLKFSAKSMHLLFLIEKILLVFSVQQRNKSDYPYRNYCVFD